jgi:purine nucleoside permease
MGPGMDPRFDLSKAYWIIAAIAGVDPKKASVASTPWAKFVVDGDLSYQIDAREIPRSWSTGYVPLGRSSPYQPPSQPFNSNGVQQVYQLNASLLAPVDQCAEGRLIQWPVEFVIQDRCGAHSWYAIAEKELNEK